MTLSELALEPFANIREYNGLLIKILTLTVKHFKSKYILNQSSASDRSNNHFSATKQRLKIQIGDLPNNVDHQGHLWSISTFAVILTLD